jgi:UDP-sulfoquinovose synthase
MRVFNQFVETFSVNRLAELVQKSGARLGLKVEVKSLPNPRKEMEDHYYNPVRTGLIELGLKPHHLDDATLDKLVQLVMRYRNSIVPERIFRGVKWKS